MFLSSLAFLNERRQMKPLVIDNEKTPGRRCSRIVGLEGGDEAAAFCCLNYTLKSN